MDRWMDGWKNARMGGWMEQCMDESKYAWMNRNMH